MKQRKARTGLTRILMIGVVVIVAGCAGNSVASHMANAQKYFAQAKYRSAMIEYQNALQKEPDNAAARLGLGRAYLALGEVANAREQLQRAQKLGTPPAQVTLPLAKVLIQQGDFDKALTLLASNKAALKKNAAEVSLLRGDALVGQGKLSDAEHAYAQALSLKPDLAPAEVGEARIAALQRDWAKAQKALDKAIAADNGNAQAWMLRGQVDFQQHDLASALTAFEKVSSGKAHHDSSPQLRFMARVHLADVQIAQNRLDAAQHNVDVLLKQAPKHPLANYLQALIEARQNKLSDAIDHLQATMKEAPKYVPGLTLMGAVKMAQGDMAQAQMYLSSAVSLDPNNAHVRQLLADAQLHRDGSQLATTAALLAKNGSAQAHEVKLAQPQGSGLKQLQQQAAGAPNNPGLQFTLAQAQMELGQNEQALTVLNRVPESSTATGLTRDRLRIAAYLRSRNLPAALDAVDEMLKAHPKDALAYVLASDVYMIANRNDDAKAAIDKARSLAPHAPEVLLNAAVLALRTGQKEQAKSDFQAILKEFPKNLQALMGLARIAALAGNAAETTQWLEQARAAAPKALAPRIVLVRLYILEKKPDQALSVAREGVHMAPHNAVALNLLAAAQWAAGHKKEALDNFQKAIDAAPDNMVFRLHLAQSQIALKQDAEAAKTLQAVIARQPNLVEAARLLILVQVRQGKIKAAFATAEQLGKQPGAGPAAAELEGDLYLRQKDYAKADQAYQRSLAGKANQMVVLKDFVAQVRAGIKQPEQTLVHWLSAHPKDLRVRTVLALWFLKQHDFQSAIQQYQQLIDIDPKDVAALNNLAWIYGEQHDPKALELARKAHAVAPDNGSVADTLGWLELQAGHTDKALELLTEAVKNNAKLPMIQYHLAVAQEKAGHKADAKATLKRLLATKAAFAGRDAAERLLKQLSTE